MGRRHDAAAPALQIYPADEHREPHFREQRFALVGFEPLDGDRARIEGGGTDVAILGIGKEVEELIAELQKTRKNVWWIKEMAPHDELTALLTNAELFLCSSIYEPLGIVNLEAMGCETAVLASRVGGIPEVVADNETGRLVNYDAGNATKFESDFTNQIEELMAKPELLTQMGKAGRVRAEKHFGWDAVAKQTIELYKSLLK